MYDVFCFLLDDDFFFFLLLIPYRLEGGLCVAAGVLLGGEPRRAVAAFLRFFGRIPELPTTAFCASAGMRLRRGMPVALLVLDSPSSSI